MASFTVGKPIVTPTPAIAVDAGLPVGSHRFQLVVVDSSGNRSQPAVAVVTIRKPGITLPGGGVVVQPGPILPGPGPVEQPTPTVPGVLAPSDVPAQPLEPVAPRRRTKRSDPK